MASNRHVVLEDYHSANSESVRDRIMEPIAFTDRHKRICALDVESLQNKYFTLITDVGDFRASARFVKGLRTEGHWKPDFP
jgi:hypothetical protein